MKLTAKQELALGAILQETLDAVEKAKGIFPKSSAEAVFARTLLHTLDKEGVPGAMRISIKLIFLDENLGV